MADILITIGAIMLFSVKAELDLLTTFVMLAFAIKPFTTLYLNIVFKGETNAIVNENDQIKQQMVYERVIAEHRCTIAARDGKVPDAIIANYEWNVVNNQIGNATKIKPTEKLIKNLKTVVKKVVPKIIQKPKVAEKPKPAIIPKK